jgi:hypothetical protein
MIENLYQSNIGQAARNIGGTLGRVGTTPAAQQPSQQPGPVGSAAGNTLSAQGIAQLLQMLKAPPPPPPQPITNPNMGRTVGNSSKVPMMSQELRAAMQRR